MKLDLTNLFDLATDPLSRYKLKKDFDQEVYERVLGDQVEPVKQAVVLEVIPPAPKETDNPSDSNEQFYGIRARIENLHESLPNPVEFIKQKKTNAEINKLIDMSRIIYSLRPIASNVNDGETTQIPQVGDVVELVEITKGVYRFDKKTSVINDLVGFSKNEDPSQLDQPAVVDPNSAQNLYANGITYEGPILKMLSKSGNKLYIGNRSTGVTPSDFWPTFRKQLQNYIAKEYPELGLEIDNLGVTRDLVASVVPSSSARVAGSKHGSGLGQDLYLHTKKYGKYTYYKEDNKKLAKDDRLVKLIRTFIKSRPDLTWGGDFGGGTGIEVAPRGILEFHHFEIKNHLMPSYFEKYKEDISKTSYKNDISRITSSKELAKLYSALLESVGQVS
jgi:hypothetical protein